MSHLFGNQHHKPLFSSPESQPYNTPTLHTKNATEHLPKNKNLYTKYYGVRAPYDTNESVSNERPQPKTRYGRTQYKDTSHLIIPADTSAPSYSPTSKKQDQQVALSSITNEERNKKQQVAEARLERRRQYQNQIEERKQVLEDKAWNQWETRREAKAIQRERYEKVFEDVNAKYRSRPEGRKAYDRNMTIEELRAITRR